MFEKIEFNDCPSRKKLADNEVSININHKTGNYSITFNKTFSENIKKNGYNSVTVLKDDERKVIRFVFGNNEGLRLTYQNSNNVTIQRKEVAIYIGNFLRLPKIERNILNFTKFGGNVIEIKNQFNEIHF